MDADVNGKTAIRRVSGHGLRRRGMPEQPFFHRTWAQVRRYTPPPTFRLTGLTPARLHYPSTAALCLTHPQRTCAGRHLPTPTAPRLHAFATTFPAYPYRAPRRISALPTVAWWRCSLPTLCNTRFPPPLTCPLYLPRCSGWRRQRTFLRSPYLLHPSAALPPTLHAQHAWATDIASRTVVGS